MNRLLFYTVLLLLTVVFIEVEGLSMKEEKKMKENLQTLQGILRNMIKLKKVTRELRKVLRKISIQVENKSSNAREKAITSPESTFPGKNISSKVNSQPSEIIGRNISSEAKYAATFRQQISNFRNLYCKQWKTCNVKMKETAKKNGTIQFPAHLGHLLQKCGRKQFFISNIATRTPMDKIYEKCCTFGFRPAEIENKAEVDCIKEGFDKLPANLKSKKGEYDYYFGTAGFDVQLNRTFVFCPDSRPLSDDLWAVGEPDNKRGIESCTLLNLEDGKVGLVDSFCLYPLRYLCEIIYEK